MLKFILPLLLCTGCYKITYLQEPGASKGPVYTQKHHTVVYGLVELDSLNEHRNLQTVCPNGFSKIEQQQSFLDALLVQLVARIIPIPIGYSPQTITIHCSGASAKELKQNKSEPMVSNDAVALK